MGRVPILYSIKRLLEKIDHGRHAVLGRFKYDQTAIAGPPLFSNLINDVVLYILSFCGILEVSRARLVNTFASWLFQNQYGFFSFQISIPGYSSIFRAKCASKRSQRPS